MKFRLIALGFAFFCGVAAAQTQSQTQTQTRPPVRTAPPATAPPAPAPKPDVTPVRGKVLEEIVARVNNSIITTTDLEKARGELGNEVKQDCAADHCTPDEFQKASIGQGKRCTSKPD